MTKTLIFVAISLSLTLLSACQSSRPALGGMDDNFGKANSANIAAHAVSPDPQLKSNTFIPANQDRVRAAREAYRTGNVKEPELINSQSD